MYVIEFDSEQMMIVTAAMEAANLILSARLHRVDPDKIISNTVIFQQHKIEQLRAQIAAGSISKHSELTDEAKKHFEVFAKAYANADDDMARDAAYEAMKTFIISQRTGAMRLLHKRSKG